MGQVRRQRGKRDASGSTLRSVPDRVTVLYLDPGTCIVGN